MTQLAEMFELKRQGFNLRRGVSVLAVLLVPLIVLAAIHQQSSTGSACRSGRCSWR